MIQEFQTIKAHNRSEVTNIGLVQSNKLASISHDSTLKIWDLNNFSSRKLGNTLSPQSQMSFDSSYLTSLLIHQNQIIIGNGNGELTFLDKNTMKPIKIINMHEDSINSIIFDANNLITVGSDGKMIRLNLKTNAFQILLEVDNPINDVLIFKERIYLSGIKSYSVDEDNKAKKIGHSMKYIEHCERLYGTSDDKGFACISRKHNCYVPCQNMISLPNGILGSSWSTFSFFKIDEKHERISYSSSRIPEMAIGDSILCFKIAPNNQNRIFCSSQGGNIYTFKLNSAYNYLQQ